VREICVPAIVGVRFDFVQELLARGVLPADRGADARAAAADDVVDLDAWLRAAGCDENELLLAACEVFALQPASQSWLDAPVQASNDDAALYRSLNAAPVHAGPPLRVAFASPFAATSERALVLPTHRAYLATPSAIAAAQARSLPAAHVDVAGEPKIAHSDGAEAAITDAPSVPRDEVIARSDWATAASDVVGPVPASAQAAATTKVPRLAQNMAGVLDAIARDASIDASNASESDGQQTGRHMMAMPPPSSPLNAVASTAARPESTVVRMMKPLEEDPVRPRMKGTPVALTPEIEAQLAEAAGLGGMTFGVRAIVKRATTAEEVAERAALEAKGATALDLLRAVGAFPAALAAKLMADVARALAALHEQGLVHRDMKPSSVLIARDGVVTLSEEGRTEASSVDEHVTDVFSLGRLFHHLLSGRDPFADGDAPPPDLMEVAPTLPELLPLVVDKLMKRERSERVQSAREAHALLAPLAHIIEARHPHLLADVVAHPAEMVKKLRVEQAFAEYLRASACMKQRPPRKREAAYALRRSIELDSMELRGQKLLRKLCASEKYTFVIPDDPALVDAKNSDDVDKLRAAGAKCLDEGAIEQAALCFRRAHDARLAEIVGDDPRQPFPYLPEVPASPSASPHAATMSSEPLRVRVAVPEEELAAPRMTSSRAPLLIAAAALVTVVVFLLARFL
jgi:hypothetical protein